MESRSFSWPGGLRTQILTGLTLLLIPTFGILGLLIDRIFVSQIDRGIEERALAAARVVSFNPDGDFAEIGRDFRLHRIVWTKDGDTREWTSTRSEGSAVVAIQRESWRVEVEPLAGEERRELKAWRSLMWSFLLAEGLLVLIFAYSFLTYVVLRPIRAIGVATERAGAGDLASPIAVLPGNEFGKVGSSFNLMLERIEEGKRRLELQLAETNSANQQLRQTQASLVRSEKLASIGQLAAGVAHEVGNPLAAISGYVELIDSDMEPEDVDDILGRVKKQLSRIRTTIRGLLDFSREGDSERVFVSVKHPLDEALELVHAIPEVKNIQIVTSIPTDLPTTLAAPEHLVQVFVNLLMNAVDAVSNRNGDGRIEVAVDVTKSDITVRVSDNGPGIPEELAHRIFDPFFTSKEPGKGTGLGLAISARLVKDADGDLRLEACDSGATFAVVLPIKTHPEEHP